MAIATPTIIFILTLPLLHFVLPPVVAAAAGDRTYDVRSFGAKPDGKSDSTKAFLAAWASSCAHDGPNTMYVPPGTYVLGNAVFNGGSCNNRATTVRIDGTLAAPAGDEGMDRSGSWLAFEWVAGVSIVGGTLDAGGSTVWACKKEGGNCPKGATSLAFYSSDNIKIKGLTSRNSQMFHMIVDGCNNVEFASLKISAPQNSPNTDGIHVEKSTGVSITDSLIGTGDDCISIGPGVSGLSIDSLTCGPGHGISIGSLGWEAQELGVQNVTVKWVKFSGTQNGVRIKTWSRPSDGFVKNVLFQHLTMSDVQNPIIIDQNYCPNNKNCPTQTSGVKISDVRYEDIHGTSATKVAVKFDCSKTRPCSGIIMDDINLTYGDKYSTSSCANVGGTADGLVNPTSCF